MGRKNRSIRIEPNHRSLAHLQDELHRKQRARDEQRRQNRR